MIFMDEIYFHRIGLEPIRLKIFYFIFEEEFNMDIPSFISHRMQSSVAFCEITTKLNITIAVNCYYIINLDAHDPVFAIKSTYHFKH